MIESDGQLATWRLMGDWLAFKEQPVERISDHRLEYLTLEGPLSGNRGAVSRVDLGHIDISSWTETSVKGALCGTHFTCELRIECNSAMASWRLSLLELTLVD
jgi:hypothetical protein